jgi:hypothetical protein
MRVPTGRAAALSVLTSILLVARSAAPAEFHERGAGQERFVGRYWSQIRPNLNFQYGCNTGWHAFRFRSDGYFVYDGKIAGSWWTDHLGNVNVLTNTGQKLLLFYDNHKRLSQRQQIGVDATSSFGTEYREYAECET